MALVEACAPVIKGSHAQELANAFAGPATGACATEPTNEQLEAVYETTARLCDEGNFKFAAGLALHLVTYKPTDPRFAFIAATCMQRLGSPASAAKFYCYALVTGGDHPATLFRLGECLLALGDPVNADKAFDAALDVSRGMEHMEELQNASIELMATLAQGRGRDAPQT